MKIFVNQGWRDADELAHIGDQILVEYEMPNGSTALRIYEGKKWKPLSYRRIPRKWATELRENEIRLIGQPQQMNKRDWDDFHEEINLQIAMA